MREELHYERLVLARLGEIALKGLNRRNFERQLLRNMSYRLRALGKYKIYQQDSRIWIEAEGEQPLEQTSVIAAIADVFGYVSASPVRRFQAELAILEQQCLDYMRELVLTKGKQSFKIEVKRINKAFYPQTYELCCHLGDLLCAHFPEHLVVNVQHPDITLTVEIRDSIYLYHEIIPAPKGLPVGMGGKGMLLLSGGIDSPVAAYCMASRGMEIECCYFHTFPYTSAEAKDKVYALARILSRYLGRVQLHIVDFTSVQLQLNAACPEEMLTVVMRRMMLRIAEALAQSRKAKCLITGESLGQVASQTLEAIVCTDKVVNMPILRPLIGTDKDATISLARKIDTFTTSILPYEDCCTVFVAKHPKTHPSLSDAERAEEKLDIPQLVCEALAKIKTEPVSFF